MIQTCQRQSSYLMSQSSVPPQTPQSSVLDGFRNLQSAGLVLQWNKKHPFSQNICSIRGGTVFLRTQCGRLQQGTIFHASHPHTVSPLGQRPPERRRDRTATSCFRILKSPLVMAWRGLARLGHGCKAFLPQSIIHSPSFLSVYGQALWDRRSPNMVEK